MRQFIAVLTLLPLLFLPLTLSAQSWPVERLQRSVIRAIVDNPFIEGPDRKGQCTIFSINEQEGKFITAGHCTTGEVTVGSVRLGVIDGDPESDISVVQGDLHLPALAMGPRPKATDPYLAVGYPGGLKEPMYFLLMHQGEFVVPGGVVEESVWNGIPPMEGTSGGPVVNKAGGVVSVIVGGGKPGTIIQNIMYGVRYGVVSKLMLKHRN